MKEVDIVTHCCTTFTWLNYEVIVKLRYSYRASAQRVLKTSGQRACHRRAILAAPFLSAPSNPYKLSRESLLRTHPLTFLHNIPKINQQPFGTNTIARIKINVRSNSSQATYRLREMRKIISISSPTQILSHNRINHNFYVCRGVPCFNLTIFHKLGSDK